MTDTPVSVTALDSLSANEFHVEIEGTIAPGIFGVSGICTRCVDLDKQKLILRPLAITKMVQQNPDLPMNRWARETLANPTSKVTRELAIVVMDDNVETRRWVYKEAWISCIEYSDFDSSNAELIAERLTIQHGGVEELWPER